MKQIILLIAFVFLILFIVELDVHAVMAQLEQVGWGILSVIGVTFVAYALASLSWLITSNKSFSLKNFGFFFVARQISEAFATLNPTGVLGGDALKVSLLKELPEYKDSGVESVIVTRVLTLLSHIFLILIVMCFIGMSVVSNLGWLGLIAFITFLSTIFFCLSQLFFSKGLLLYRLLRQTSKKIASRRFDQLVTGSRSFNYHAYKIRESHSKVFYAAFFILVAHWILGAVEFVLILNLLGIGISIWDGFVIEIGTSCIRSLVSFVPGQIGFDEYGNKFFLEFIGVAGSGIWISVCIIKRIRQLFWIVIGISFYLLRNIGYTKQITRLKIFRGGNTIH